MAMVSGIYIVEVQGESSGRLDTDSTPREKELG